MGVTARIVVRIMDASGKRRWVPTAGRKSDPQGSHYLRYCVGSSPRYEHAGDRYDVALAAKIKLERRLKAESIGAIIPDEPAAPLPSLRYRIADVTEAHIAEQSKPER